MVCGSLKKLKYFLYCTNAFLWVAGLAFVAIGAWITNYQMVVDLALKAENIFVNETTLLTVSRLYMSKLPMVTNGPYFLFGAGALLFLIGFFGCCRVCRHSDVFMLTYAVLCIVACSASVIAGTYQALYQDVFQKNVTQSLTKLLLKFDGGVDTNDDNTRLWNDIMMSAKCCGINGQADFSVNYKNMTPYWASRMRLTYVTKTVAFVRPKVPVACCPIVSNTVDPSCPMNATNAYTTSCQAGFVIPLSTQIGKYCYAIIGITFGTAAFCLLTSLSVGFMVHRDGVIYKRLKFLRSVGN